MSKAATATPTATTPTAPAPDRHQGRHPLPEGERRCCRVMFSLTPDEHRLLVNDATASGHATIAEHARAVLVGGTTREE